MQLFRVIAISLCALFAGCGDSDGNSRGSGSGGSQSPAPGAFPVADATVTGPITGGLWGHALWDSWFSLADLGYVEEEYFISGVAKQQPDGAEAAYTTRIIVARPQDPADFNGTVLMDWVNVTAQFENAVDITEAHDFLLREGYAFVHVSAQSAGLCCVPELTPKLWDPVRYMPINHPGDDYSFDMFAQIAKALRAPVDVDPMGGLQVRKVLAAGQSQSASRLYDYVNSGYAKSRVIDGILIHGGGSKVFSEPPPVPVIHLLSDAEADTEEPGTTENYSLWEMGGSSHTDLYVGYHQVMGQSQRAVLHLQNPGAADDALHATAANYGEQIHPLLAVCVVAGSTYPMRYAVKASLHHLNRWAQGGPRPPTGPRFEFAGAGLATDGFGNTRGGIRYPVVDVPIARYLSNACPLGGITVPFTELEIAAAYASHADYYCQMKAATERTVNAGFMLPEDGEELMARVEGAANRFTTAGVRDCE